MVTALLFANVGPPPCFPDGTAKIWSAASGVCMRTLAGHRAWLQCAEFSPDQTRVLTSAKGGSAKVWCLESGKCVGTFGGHGFPVMRATFSPNGEQIFSGSLNGSAKLWDMASGRCLLLLKSFF